MSVYFAQAGRYTKIGHSANPLERASTITTNGTRPDDLPRASDVRLLGWVPGNTRRELEMHRHFADQRATGEWFVIDEDEIRELIWANPCGVDIQRMSAMAVFAAVKNPDATRDDLAAAGIPVEAVSLADALARDTFLGGAA